MSFFSKAMAAARRAVNGDTNLHVLVEKIPICVNLFEEKARLGFKDEDYDDEAIGELLTDADVATNIRPHEVLVFILWAQKQLSDLNLTKGRLTKAEAIMDADADQIAELEETNEELQEEVQGHKQKIVHLTRETTTLAAENSALAGTNRALEVDLVHANAEIRQLKQEKLSGKSFHSVGGAYSFVPGGAKAADDALHKPSRRKAGGADKTESAKIQKQLEETERDKQADFDRFTAEIAKLTAQNAEQGKALAESTQKADQYENYTHLLGKALLGTYAVAIGCHYLGQLGSYLGLV